MAQEVVSANTYKPLERLERSVTMTALVIPDGVGYDQWSKFAEGISIERKRIKNGSLMFYVGDWLAYGERNLAEKYAEALEVTGYNKSTLYNAKYVASSIEPERRREDLSWSHHLAVASLEKEEQDQMLAWASEKSLTTAQLRHMINQAKGGAVEVESQQIEGNGHEEVSASTLDDLKRDIPIGQQMAEDFFNLSQAFIATLQETGEVAPEHTANLQATAKALSEVTERIFRELMSL